MTSRLTCLLLVLGLAAGFAQEPVAPPQDPPVLSKGSELSWDVDPVIIELDYKRRILYLIGDVKVKVDDLTIRCDNLVAWLPEELGKKEDAPKEEAGAEGPDPAETDPEIVPGSQEQRAQAGRFVRELYVEGHVVMRRGQEVTRAERAYIDVRSGRGVVINAVSRTTLRGRQESSPLVIRADEIRLLSQSRWQARDVMLTTDPFVRPSTHIKVGQLDVVKDPPGYQRIDGQDQLVENTSFEARDNVFHVGRTPLLWLPDFAGDTAAGAGARYIEDVRFGNSNRFGQELGITVGDDIRVGENDEVWGHWSLPVDWLSKRGWGVGGVLTYQQDDYRGWLIARYQHDRGRDRFFGEPPTQNRGWIGWNHRHQLPWDLQLDLEANLVSDRGYYPIFFENLDKTEKPLENIAFLKRAWTNQQASLLASYRFNDWLTTTEHLPELRYDLVSEPLFDLGSTTLLLNTTVRVGKLRRKVDEALNVPGRTSWRVDVDNLFEVPVLAGPFKLTPFAGLRYTFYDKDEDGDDRSRLGFTFGGTLTMQAWKTWDTQGGLFGLDGLRHVILPEVTFRQTTGVQVQPDELRFFDEVETFDDVQVVEFSLRNLFQTIRHRDGGPAVSSIVELELEMDYFPNATRDNGGDPFGNLEADLIVRFSDELQVAAAWEIDWYGGGLQVFDAVAGYTPSETLQTYAGFRHFEDTYDAIFLQVNWRIEEKWLLNFDTSYDFKRDQGIDHNVTFSRFGVDWVFEIGARVDVGENDFSFRIALSPRALYRSILQPRQLRHEPRLGFVGRELRR